MITSTYAHGRVWARVPILARHRGIFGSHAAQNGTEQMSRPGRKSAATRKAKQSDDPPPVPASATPANVPVPDPAKLVKRSTKSRYHTTLDSELYLAARIQALKDGRELNEVIEELLHKWIAEREKP